jgi:hypothetical protein
MERINIVLISRAKNFTHRLKLSRGLLHFGVIFLLIFIASTIVLCYRNTVAVVNQRDLGKLEAENHCLLKRLDSLSDLAMTLKQRIETGIAKDYRERTYMEMAYIHPDVWAMGMGGDNYDFSNRNIPIQTQKILTDVDKALEISCGQINLRKKSLAEIELHFDNKLDQYACIPSINPLPCWSLGSPFGYRVDPFTGEIRMHWGVDIGAPTGTLIHATADGIVIFTGWDQGYGLSIEIDHGYGFVTRYAHCQTILMKPGDKIKRGQIIATVGSTGRATCSHLHYEVNISGIKVNPSNYIDLSNMVFD